MKRRVTGKKGGHVKLALTVEAGFLRGRQLTQKSIGADNLAAAPSIRVSAFAVDDEKMITERIEFIGIATVG